MVKTTVSSEIHELYSKLLHINPHYVIKNLSLNSRQLLQWILYKSRHMKSQSKEYFHAYYARLF